VNLKGYERYKVNKKCCWHLTTSVRQWGHRSKPSGLARVISSSQTVCAWRWMVRKTYLSPSTGGDWWTTGKNESSVRHSRLRSATLECVTLLYQTDGITKEVHGLPWESRKSRDFLTCEPRGTDWLPTIKHCQCSTWPFSPYKPVTAAPVPPLYFLPFFLGRWQPTLITHDPTFFLHFLSFLPKLSGQVMKLYWTIPYLPF